MSEISLGKLLPNLTVTLGNDKPNDETDCLDLNDIASDPKVEIVRPNVELLQNPKIYKSKDGGFATGIDLIAQESSGILDKRAERFGINQEEPKLSISLLYESMGIDIQNRNSAKMKQVRLDALHVRGVQELNTEEVFQYFQDYGPASIEWINDCSCNVLWFDETTCARALIGLSKPLPASFSEELLGSKMDTDNPDQSSLEMSDKEKDGITVDSSLACESTPLDIPVPPGQWRLGATHANAKTIIIRFATKDDKKLPGAEKRSNYYKKYGNPNYGGLKGLISSSRKHKSQSAANRWAVEKGSNSSKTSSSLQSDSSVPKVSKQKTIRMRMYADDEELKTKNSRSKHDFYEKKASVHSRLGAKYTADELCHLGAYQDLDSFSDNQKMSRESGNFSSKTSDGDLRSKLKRLRSNNKNAHSERYSPYYESDKSHSFKKIRRIDDLKAENRSYYKRKHRSPLCADDIDDESGESSD